MGLKSNIRDKASLYTTAPAESLPPAQGKPHPCAACQCVEFWCDVSDRRWCRECYPPPSPHLVRGLCRVILTEPGISPRFLEGDMIQIHAGRLTRWEFGPDGMRALQSRLRGDSRPIKADDRREIDPLADWWTDADDEAG